MTDRRRVHRAIGIIIGVLLGCGYIAWCLYA